MFHNKALGAAIAMALSLGVNSTEAGSLQICTGLAGSTATFSTSAACTSAAPPTAAPLTYAYEQFGSSGTLSYPFRARYTVASTIGKSNDSDFYITFTLSNGATWQDARASSDLTFTDSTGTTVAGPKISIVSKGSTTDSEVSYLVNSRATNGVTPAQVLNFEFKVSNAQYALKSQGGQITLTAKLTAAQQQASPTMGTVLDSSPQTQTLATSTEGADIQLTAPTDGLKAYISVLSDGTQFEGSGAKSATQVYYGNVKIATKTPATLAMGATAPTGTGTGWDVSTNLSKGKLTIDNGNFNASGVPSSGQVYIDNGSGASLVNPTSFSPDKTTATWDFTKPSDLQSIFSATSRNIVLNVDGKTSIIENRKTPPKATLYVEYSGGVGVNRTAQLRHLKKNGSVCTLYNIPAPNEGQDKLNIRITNDSATVKGFVKGTLRDANGNEIYKGKFLVPQNGLAAHQTVHLTMSDLTAGGSTWAQRAVLTVESNIPDGSMQVFGFLRNTGSKPGFPESPLMNMSTGATGNGCD